MIKIGLTGGIASGKSSVANWFREKGLTVIDADQIAHTIMADKAVVTAVEQEFGPEYIEDSGINRSLLGSLVFQDKEMKRKLEKLLHPLIYQEMQRQASQAASKNEKAVILDIPLLFETGWDKRVDEVWVVYVTRDIQLVRLMARNKLTREEADLRIASQMPLEEKAQKAGRIINNSGSWQETEAQLEAIWTEVQKWGERN